MWILLYNLECHFGFHYEEKVVTVQNRKYAVQKTAYLKILGHSYVISYLQLFSNREKIKFTVTFPYGAEAEFSSAEDVYQAIVRGEED